MCHPCSSLLLVLYHNLKPQKHKMLEKLSFFTEKSSVLRKRCWFWIIRRSLLTFISNQAEIIGVTGRKCNNQFSSLVFSKLLNIIHDSKKLRGEKDFFWFYYRNGGFKQVAMDSCGNKTSKQINTISIRTQETKSNCPIHLDEFYVLNRINKYLLPHEDPSLTTTNNAKNAFSVRTEHERYKQNVSVMLKNSLPLITANRSFSTVSNCSDQQQKDNTSSSGALPSGQKMCSAPKNVLHNAYDVVAQELNNKDLKLRPTYSVVKSKSKSSWCCTYNVKWPDTMKFLSTGQTKKEASYKAALSALSWLHQNGKMTKDGYPIIIDKKEVKDIIRKEQPKFALDSDTRNQMKIITNLYKDEFLPLLANDMKDNESFYKLKEKEESDLNVASIQQKVFTSSKYLTKEKMSLPISPYKEQFINLLNENRVVIIKGQPGCGKSTRIPQYVLESWAKNGLKNGKPCKIAVTQPRRIAAISLASRVSDERDESCGHIVGYQIRLNSNFNPVTGRILYCTTGILLKHLQTDINLQNFTHVILDEAHERDINTDLLMNLLRTALAQNDKLRLIVMSATMDVRLFQNYFKNAPVMDIPGFTYPVKSHFLDDLIDLNLRKSLKLSAGNNEILSVVHEDVVKLITHIHKLKGDGAILCFLPGWEDITKVEKLIPTSNDMIVLCLHSRLQDVDQRRIFSRTSPGVRKIILSTNIAETSVTVDDVVYVIDTGIHKENRFDNEKGVSCIDNYWISQSNMRQRKGRAGRVQPGECFHLYTKSKYESFDKFTDPEILKTSLTKFVLNSKVYSNNMDAIEFMNQLPTSPEKSTTRRAVRELRDLKLLDDNENLTSLGRTLANFQLEPKLAKVLVNAIVYKCVTPIVDIITIFSADTELFSSGLVDKETIKNIKSKASKYSDHLALMRLFEAWLELIEENDAKYAERYCADANLVHHKLITINKLRKVHFDYLHELLHHPLSLSDDYSDNDELVKAVMFSGVGTLLRHQNWDIIKGRYKKKNIFYTNQNQKASVTSESVNFKRTSFPSDFLVYFNEIRSNLRRTTLIRECSVIAPLAVLLFSDKDLTVKEIGSASNKAILGIKNTRIEFLCSKEEAEEIWSCKEALTSAYLYFISEMTEGGNCNLEVYKVWDTILKHLNSILLKYRTD